MASPYVGEIRMFGGIFAPLDWHFCDGTLLPIDQYPPLYNLIGTTYGGDGINSFALPDLRGRSPIHQGTTPQGATYALGQVAGTETVTLVTSQLPIHSHVMMSASGTSVQSPAGAYPGVASGQGLTEAFIYETAAVPAPTLAQNSIGPGGGSQPHENMQPFLCVTFIIALYGIYPSHS